MLMLIIISILLLFFISINKSLIKQRKLDEEEAKRKLELELEAEMQKKAVFEEIEKYKDKISNYDEIKSLYDQMSISKLKNIITAFKRHYYLIEKYGEEEGEKLYNHHYWIGMTEEQVVEVKGKPSKIEIEALKTKTKRVLIYGNKSSGDVFTVVNGAVERFVDR